MDDGQKIIAITGAFIELLQMHKFDRPRSYVDLCYSLAEVVDHFLDYDIRNQSAYGAYINTQKNNQERLDKLKDIQKQLNGILVATKKRETNER
jgi:hypothetical protein